MDLLTPESLPYEVRADRPGLQNGDELHAKEFIRRFDKMPDLKKAELVDGTVFMGSPVSHDDHGRYDSILQIWLGVYAARHPQLDTSPNSTVIIDSETVVQPDGILFDTMKLSPSQRTGRLLTGIPELVAEVSASTASLDNNRKRKVYERAGVKEYIVWRVFDNEIDFWRYDDDAEIFTLTYPNENGFWESAVFPGLILDVPAALRVDRAAVISGLD